MLQVDQDVSHYIDAWQKQTGRQFLVNGITFEEFIRKQRDDYNAEKENEKHQRVSFLFFLKR